jgi:hypothetical protein
MATVGSSRNPGLFVVRFAFDDEGFVGRQTAIAVGDGTQPVISVSNPEPLLIKGQPDYSHVDSDVVKIGLGTPRFKAQVRDFDSSTLL